MRSAQQFHRTSLYCLQGTPPPNLHATELLDEGRGPRLTCHHNSIMAFTSASQLVSSAELTRARIC
jgi:hypothetical protein